MSDKEDRRTEERVKPFTGQTGQRSEQCEAIINLEAYVVHHWGLLDP